MCRIYLNYLIYQMYLSTYLSVYLSIDLSIYLSAYHPIVLIYPIFPMYSIYPLSCPSYLSFLCYLSIHLSISLVFSVFSRLVLSCGVFVLSVVLHRFSLAPCITISWPLQARNSDVSFL